MSEKIQVAAKKPEAKRENKASQMQKTGPSQSISSPVEQILFLQRTIGNQAVGRLIKSGALQAKLRIGQPGDIYEQEADRVAEQVMRMLEPKVSNETKVSNPAWNNSIQRKCPGCIKGTKIEKEEEEGKLHKKEASGLTPEVTHGVENSITSLLGGGQPLPETARAFYETRFGADFGQVRVHTGSHAAETAKSINAKAFTVGGNIVFGAGQYSSDSHEGRRLLAHELTHTIQQGIQAAEKGEPPATFSPAGLLKTTSTPNRVIQRRVLAAAEETAAISSGRGLFNSLTVRVLQTITGVPAADRDGVVGPQTVRAISNWQTARGLTDNGIVDLASMNRLVTDSLAANRAEHGIQLVLDFFNLNTSSDTLTVRHRTGASTFEGFTFRGIVPIPNFFPGSTTFEEGNLRVIEVGDPAFASATTLRDTIQRELARAAPARAPVGATPARLNTIQVRDAVRYTSSKYSDERSVRAIQGLVGAPVSGIVDATTVQYIAEAQHAAGIGIDGKVGIETTENFYTQMIARGNPNSALRLLVDFFDMKDQGNLLSVFFDPTVAALASTDFRPSEPVRVRVGPNALTLPFSGAVHNIAHEMEHVRRLREGIVSANTHEFLSEALEVLSVGMPEEPLDPVNPTHDAFINDATRCLDNWIPMPVADRRRFRSMFIAVRRKVLQRIDAGTAPQRAANAALRARYVAVVLP